MGDDLSKLNFASANQLADENLGFGDSTWAALSEMEEEFDTKPFYQAVRDFYVASLNKMLKKFPFGNTILKDLGILNPDMVCTYNFTTIKTLAKCFPQLELAESASIDALRGEAMDFKLSPIEHPTVEMYKSATGDDKPRPGRFWYEVGQMKLFDGEPRLPLLVRLMSGLMSIPASNADSERGFSMLRKVHTDQRLSQKQSTIISLMTIKFNSDECCHDSIFSEEFLTKCKKATVLHKLAIGSTLALVYLR